MHAAAASEYDQWVRARQPAPLQQLLSRVAAQAERLAHARDYRIALQRDDALRVEHLIGEISDMVRQQQHSQLQLCMADYRAAFTCLALVPVCVPAGAAGSSLIRDKQTRALATMLLQQVEAVREEGELGQTVLAVPLEQARQLAEQPAAAHVAEGFYQLLSFGKFAMRATNASIALEKAATGVQSNAAPVVEEVSQTGLSDQRLRLKSLLAELSALYAHPLAAARVEARRIVSSLLSTVPVVAKGGYVVWFSFEEQGRVLSACRDFGMPELAMEMWPRLLQQQKLQTRVSLLPKLKPKARAAAPTPAPVVPAPMPATVASAAASSTTRATSTPNGSSPLHAEPVLAAVVPKPTAPVRAAAEVLPPPSRLRYATAATTAAPRPVAAHPEAFAPRAGVSWSTLTPAASAPTAAPFALSESFAAATPAPRVSPVASSPSPRFDSFVREVESFKSSAAILADHVHVPTVTATPVRALEAMEEEEEAAEVEASVVQTADRHLAAQRSSSRAMRESFRPRGRTALVGTESSTPRVPFHVLDKLLACVALSPSHGVSASEQLLHDMQAPTLRQKLDLSGFPQVALASLAAEAMPPPEQTAQRQEHLQRLAYSYEAVALRSAWTHAAYYRALCLAERYQEADGVLDLLLVAPCHAEVADEKFLFFALHSIRTRLRMLEEQQQEVAAASRAASHSQSAARLIARADLLWHECKTRLTPPSSRLLLIMLQCHALVRDAARQLELLDEAQQIEAQLQATLPVGAAVPRIVTAKCLNFAANSAADRAALPQAAETAPTATAQVVAAAAVPTAAPIATVAPVEQAAVAAPAAAQPEVLADVAELSAEFERAFLAADVAGEANAAARDPIAEALSQQTIVDSAVAAAPSVAAAAVPSALPEPVLPAARPLFLEPDVSYLWTAESVEDALGRAHASQLRLRALQQHNGGESSLIQRLEAWVEQRALRSSGGVLAVIDRLFGPQQHTAAHAHTHYHAGMRAL